MNFAKDETLPAVAPENSAGQGQRWFAAAMVLSVVVAVVVWGLLRRPLEPVKTEGSPSKIKTTLLDSTGGQIQQPLRPKAEAAASQPIPQLIKQLCDDTTDPFIRRRCIYQLAKAGTPEAVDALQQFFKTASIANKAAIAQVLGAFGNPRYKSWLGSLLDDPEPQVVLGAIRGLSGIGGEDVTASLAKLLLSAETPLAVKIEAAGGLGVLHTDSACDALVRVIGESQNAELKTAVMTALGNFPFSPKIERIFRDYLASPAESSELRANAVEALANSTPDAAPFLLEMAQNDLDWRVRAGAAWAISAYRNLPQCAGKLLDLAEAEKDEIVRRRLYEALLTQQELPAQRLLALVSKEEDAAARMAAFNTLGAVVSRQPELADQFDNSVVPELLQIAMSQTATNIRMRAVFALRRARTPAALAALKKISHVVEPAIATAAKNGCGDSSQIFSEREKEEENEN